MRTTRWIHGLLLVAALFGTASKKWDRLAPYERDHHQALSVFFEDEKKETKEWLKLETPEARDQWLKDKGYWNHFYKYDEIERKEILERVPKIGWTQDMLYMAWGAPYRKLNSTKRTAQNTQIFQYRIQVSKDGHHLVYTPGSKATYKAIEQYTQEITLDDRKISAIDRRDGWK